MAYTTIDDPEAYFQVVLFTGDTSAQSITLPGDTNMQPDMVWIKVRDASAYGVIQDSVRGVTGTDSYNIITDAASTDVSDAITALNSDGFTVGTDANDRSNYNSQTHVAWCWKANGSGSSNEAGSINTTATSANTTSGFSIITYTGNSTSGATIGHGLGVKPAMIFCKNLASTQDWLGYHESFGATKHIKLNETEAVGTASTRFNDTEPTTSVFTVGNDPQTNASASMLAYCFANVQGFSKFGSYTGNGEAINGPMVFTGFKVRWVIIKNIGGVEPWDVWDSERSSSGGRNLVDKDLKPSSNAAEQTGSEGVKVVDFLSNGFKIRGSNTEINQSGNTHIYAAFAEAPFVNSNGVPATAV